TRSALCEKIIFDFRFGTGTAYGDSRSVGKLKNHQLFFWNFVAFDIANCLSLEIFCAYDSASEYIARRIFIIRGEQPANFFCPVCAFENEGSIFFFEISELGINRIEQSIERLAVCLAVS